MLFALVSPRAGLAQNQEAGSLYVAGTWASQQVKFYDYKCFGGSSCSWTRTVWTDKILYPKIDVFMNRWNVRVLTDTGVPSDTLAKVQLGVEFVSYDPSTGQLDFTVNAEVDTGTLAGVEVAVDFTVLWTDGTFVEAIPVSNDCIGTNRHSCDDTHFSFGVPPTFQLAGVGVKNFTIRRAGGTAVALERLHLGLSGSIMGTDLQHTLDCGFIGADPAVSTVCEADGVGIVFDPAVLDPDGVNYAYSEAVDGIRTLPYPDSYFPASSPLPSDFVMGLKAFDLRYDSGAHPVHYMDVGCMDYEWDGTQLNFNWEGRLWEVAHPAGGTPHALQSVDSTCFIAME